MLNENHSREWRQDNYSQLIYDFTNSETPEFRLICTSPDKLPTEMRGLLESLDLPGFRIPNTYELEHQPTLEKFLAQAMNLKLSGTDNRLKIFDEQGFVLTLDFTMKLLQIHERVVCGLPCVIEGETGVSKTALTWMYSLLINQSKMEEVAAELHTNRQELNDFLADHGLSVNDVESIQDGQVADDLRTMITERSAARSEVFADLQNAELSTRIDKDLALLVKWFNAGHLESLFHPINMDSSLQEKDILEAFREPRRIARKLAGTDVSVIVFLDGTFLV